MSEPGARLVFTHGLTLSPRVTALRASNPAPIITLGFDVFVQLVIAATTTEPWSRPSRPGATVSGATATAAGWDAGELFSPHFAGTTFAGFASLSIASSACWNLYSASLSETLSCGRFGPARLGSTV